MFRSMFLTCNICSNTAVTNGTQLQCIMNTFFNHSFSIVCNLDTNKSMSGYVMTLRFITLQVPITIPFYLSLFTC